MQIMRATFTSVVQPKDVWLNDFKRVFKEFRLNLAEYSSMIFLGVIFYGSKKLAQAKNQTTELN